MTAGSELPAGEFSRWLGRMRAVLAGQGDADVPCDDCCACCTTSHFVHVAPAETRALARIPRELLFPAPGQPEGTMLMGYDQHGRCPMLEKDGRCSIYEDRPLTCRTYDCRIFAAARIAADRDPLTRQARRWKFSYPAPADQDEHAAVRAAARFVRERAECFPAGAAPREAVPVALLAIKVYGVFLQPGGESGATGHASSDRDAAEAVMTANERFEAAADAAAAAIGGRAVRQDGPDA